MLFGSLVFAAVLWGEREGGAGRDVEQQVCGRRRLRDSGEGEVWHAMQRGGQAAVLGSCWGSGLLQEIRLQIPWHVGKPAGLGLAHWFSEYRTGLPIPFSSPRLIRWQWLPIPVLRGVTLVASNCLDTLV